MNNIVRFALILFIVNLVAVSILSTVYSLTEPRIKKQQRLIQENALRQVMPTSVGERIESIDKDGGIKCWKVFKGNSRRVSGYIFIAKKYGYSSNIETMVGMRADGIITGVRILSQNETPGLGAKIVETASGRTLINALKMLFLKKKKTVKELEPYFTQQFTGLNIKKIGLSEDTIQAITGATISSRAVVDAIKQEGMKILEK